LIQQALCYSSESDIAGLEIRFFHGVEQRLQALFEVHLQPFVGRCSGQASPKYRVGSLIEFRMLSLELLDILLDQRFKNLAGGFYGIRLAPCDPFAAPCASSGFEPERVMHR
jgi:hypothetical protein